MAWVKDLTLFVDKTHHNMLCLREIRNIFLSNAKINILYIFCICSIRVAFNVNAFLTSRTNWHLKLISEIPKPFFTNHFHPINIYFFRFVYIYIYIYIYSTGLSLYNCSGRSFRYFVINFIPTYLRGNMTGFSWLFLHLHTRGCLSFGVIGL